MLTLSKVIPDELQIVGYSASGRAETNSIFDMINLSTKGLAHTANLEELLLRKLSMGFNRIGQEKNEIHG